MTLAHFRRIYCPDCLRTRRFLWAGSDVWVCERCSRRVEGPRVVREGAD